jgi:hypothetical protein
MVGSDRWPLEKEFQTNEPSNTCCDEDQTPHEGRKRIDIVMENGAHTGIFYALPNIRRLPCAYVPLECKNYGREVGNPELDQLAGRFSVNRGKVGFLCCREFQDRDLFIRRCRDNRRSMSAIALFSTVRSDIML